MVVDAGLKKPFAESFLKTPPADSLWTLVYFWGSWCGACLADLPEVEKVYQKWISTKKINFIAYDFQTPNGSGFLNKKGYSFTSEKVTESFTEPNGIYAYPSRLLVKPDGRFMKLENENWIEKIQVITGLD